MVRAKKSSLDEAPKSSDEATPKKNETKKAVKKTAARKAPAKKAVTKKTTAKKASPKKVAKKKTTKKAAQSEGLMGVSVLNQEATVELIKRGVLIGIGAIVQTSGAVKGFVNDQAKQLADNDNLTKKAAKQFGDDIVGMVQTEKKVLETKIQDTVDTQVSKLVRSLNLATKDDLKKLKEQVKKSPAKKPAAKKTTAKKSTAKKATKLKTAARKAPAKKAATKKTTTKKTAAKKTAKK